MSLPSFYTDLKPDLQLKLAKEIFSKHLPFASRKKWGNPKKLRNHFRKINSDPNNLTMFYKLNI